jgi:beta-xylosidase
MSEELKLDPDVTREDVYNWFKSERQAHLAAKKELEELQDAILDKFLSDPMDPDKFKILMNAMKQSMERAKQ